MIQFNKTRNLSHIVKPDREYITYSSIRQGIYHIWFNKTGYISHIQFTKTRNIISIQFSKALNTSHTPQLAQEYSTHHK